MPWWPPPIAVAPSNATVPKFASGSVWQPPTPQVDGASAIHSADERSGADIRNRFPKAVWRVRFLILIVTILRLTATAAAILSPGLTRSFTVTGGAGSSSYQTE